MNPTWLLLLLFGAAFVALLIKICFDPSFRKDMLAQEGQASIGPLSVQGATFTVLFVALGYAMYKELETNGKSILLRLRHFVATGQIFKIGIQSMEVTPLAEARSLPRL